MRHVTLRDDLPTDPSPTGAGAVMALCWDGIAVSAICNGVACGVLFTVGRCPEHGDGAHLPPALRPLLLLPPGASVECCDGS